MNLQLITADRRCVSPEGVHILDSLVHRVIAAKSNHGHAIIVTSFRTMLLLQLACSIDNAAYETSKINTVRQRGGSFVVGACHDANALCCPTSCP